MDSTTLMPERPSSPALGYAVACGLPMRMSYTLSETALYSGLSEYQLREAIKCGTLRGARIPVTAMDVYMGSR